jgi:hypothetical protein
MRSFLSHLVLEETKATFESFIIVMKISKSKVASNISPTIALLLWKPEQSLLSLIF